MTLDLARWVGVVVLLLPIAVGAAWLTGSRRVEGFTIAVGVAAAAAVVALLGIGLSFPFELGAVAWAVAIGVVDAVVIAALLVFAASRPEDGRRRSPKLAAPLRGIGRQWVALLIGALAVAVTVAAVAIARDSAASTRRETTFTQLWMLPTASGRSATLGVRNVEDAPRTYRLRVMGPRGALLSRTVRLPSGATRTLRVRLPLTPVPQRVAATARALGSGDQGRRVDVWTRGHG